MKFLQLNLYHCQPAYDLLRQSVVGMHIDLILLSEPYKIGGGAYWTTELRNKAAIWTCCPKFPQLENPYFSNGFFRATVSSITTIAAICLPESMIKTFRASPIVLGLMTEVSLNK